MSSVNEPRDSLEVSRAPEPPASGMEEDLETADPMSATWPAEYLMNVRLAGPQADIPLFDYRLQLGEKIGLWKFRRFRGDNRFDASKEDYWLFSVHMNAAKMQFLIGGEEPAYTRCAPNWHDAFTSEETVIEDKNSSCISRAIFGLEKERLVAVRAPKATNPAITVWGQGNYAALNWVGLFVKSTSADTHEFIAVKTNKTLLPKYDDRGTVSKMQGADVTGRSITLFPKQLFGTEGKNGATYDKFVTDNPNNKLGDAHWNSISQVKRVHGKYPSYTWNTSGNTWITSTYDDNKIGMVAPQPTRKRYFNYMEGTNLKETDTQGLEMLARMLGSLLRGVLGLTRGDFATVINEVGSLTDELFGRKLADKGADVKGLVTVLVEIANEFRKVDGKNINTDGVKDLVTKLRLVDTDFGRG